MSGSHVIPSQCLYFCLHGQPPAVVLLRLCTAKATPPLHATPTTPSIVRLQPQVPLQTVRHAILTPSRLRGRRTGMVTAWPVVPEDHPEVLDLLAIGQHQRAWKRSSDRLRRLVRDDRLRKATTAAAEERRRRLTQTGLPTFFPAPGGEK